MNFYQGFQKYEVENLDIFISDFEIWQQNVASQLETCINIKFEYQKPIKCSFIETDPWNQLKYYESEIIQTLFSGSSPPVYLRIHMLCLPCLGQTLTNSVNETTVTITIDDEIEARCYDP